MSIMVFPMCLSYCITNVVKQRTLYSLHPKNIADEFDYRKPLNVANVEQVLNLIRPSLQSDGGDCKLICLENSTVIIELMGNCVNCPMKNETVKNGIEASLQKYLRSVDPIRVIIRSDDS